MKVLSGLFGSLVLIAVLCFAMANLHAVPVGLWPLQDTVDTPLYLVALVPLVFGLVVGSFFGWMNGLRYKREARKLNKELVVLNSKITALQNPAPPPQAKKPFWSLK